MCSNCLPRRSGSGSNRPKRSPSTVKEKTLGVGGDISCALWPLRFCAVDLMRSGLHQLIFPTLTTPVLPTGGDHSLPFVSTHALTAVPFAARWPHSTAGAFALALRWMTQPYERRH